MIDEIDIIMRENSRCFGCKKKTHEKEMLDKYPDMYKITACHICKADLRYLNRIHRIYNLLGKRQLNWYCDKCYKKYKKVK